MKLAWITDPHFDFLSPMQSVRFGQWLGKAIPSDAVVITGDISEAPVLDTLLPGFAAGYKKPVFFVLGNHDYYFGSFETVREKARTITATYPNLTWLDEAGVVELTPEFALVGNGGWYDVKTGHAEHSRLEMSDFHVIQDLKPLYRHDLVKKCRELAKEMAEQTEPVLRGAAQKYKNVFFATHVPPFREATWHNGLLSDATWAPWFSNLTFGRMLSDVAHDFPDTHFTVLCGHTHSEGVFHFRENMVVLTGHSQYSNPRVSKVFDLSQSSKRAWTKAPR